MDIDNLIERLMRLTYIVRDEEFRVIPIRYKNLVSNEIIKWSKEYDNSLETVEINKKIAELEAKVYTYEKIIANSNFAPIMREISEKK